MRTQASSADFSHLQPLQQRLGHRFTNPQLLQQALTHRSWGKAAQQPSKEACHHNNEVLEFLGDAVLSLVIADHLYTCYPHAQEGALSRLRANLVCQSNLCQSARKLQLNRWIRASKAVCASGALHQPSTLADALEAVLAAVYLDAGLSAAQQVIHRVLQLHQGVADQLPDKDAKTQLQEKLQKVSGHPPQYRVIDSQGPQHAPCFTVAVVMDKEVLAQGQGSSKQKAQQQAASLALQQLRQKTQPGKSTVREKKEREH